MRNKDRTGSRVQAVGKDSILCWTMLFVMENALVLSFSKGLSILLIYRVLCCTLFYHLYFKQTFFFLPAFWRTGVFGFLVYSFNLHQRDKRI